MFICSSVEDSFMQRRRKKSHNLRNALVVLIVFVVIISVVVAEYQMRGAGSPTYSAFSATSTTAGSACTFSVLWSDSMNVSGYIFGTNNTGGFVNDTWTPFFDFVNQTFAYSRVTETLDSNIGDVVSWGFWCNGTGNRWSEFPLQILYVMSDKILLNTNMGNITILLFDDMPITTGNFKNLTRIGRYDGTNFTRIVPGFVIQGGDSSAKPGQVDNITDELPNKHSNLRGYVAMAKTSAANSATDQFFINLGDNSATLDSNYSVFGQVISGMDVVDAISHLVPSSANATGYDGPPSVPVTIVTAQFVN